MGVRRAISTRCGSEIVAGDADEIEARLKQMADKRGVEAQIAHDGWEVVLGGGVRDGRRLSIPENGLLTADWSRLG